MGNITAQHLYQMTSKFRGGIYVWKKEKCKRARSVQVSGSRLMNLFKNGGIFYAGDLLKVDDENKQAWALKVFTVAAAVGSTDTVITVTGDQLSHVPSVGDIIMKTPATATTTGQSTEITAVSWDNDVYTLTVDTALGALAAGDMLVEGSATSATSADTVLIDKVNSFIAADEIQGAPNYNVGGFEHLDFVITPVEHDSAIKARMSPIPAYLEAYNKANYPETYFEL